jgi:hypothetical protein
MASGEGHVDEFSVKVKLSDLTESLVPWPHETGVQHDSAWANIPSESMELWLQAGEAGRCSLVEPLLPPGRLDMAASVLATSTSLEGWCCCCLRSSASA